MEWNPTFNGDVRWNYEIIFAEDFSRIIGGQMRGEGPHGADRSAMLFNDPQDMVIRRGMCYVQKPLALSSRAKALSTVLAEADSPMEPDAAVVEGSHLAACTDAAQQEQQPTSGNSPDAAVVDGSSPSAGADAADDSSSRCSLA